MDFISIKEMIVKLKKYKQDDIVVFNYFNVVDFQTYQKKLKQFLTNKGHNILTTRVKTNIVGQDTTIDIKPCEN